MCKLYLLLQVLVPSMLPKLKHHLHRTREELVFV
jgi:hypothetical protein